jgi:GAF domain-containing protein
LRAILGGDHVNNFIVPTIENPMVNLAQMPCNQAGWIRTFSQLIHENPINFDAVDSPNNFTAQTLLLMALTADQKEMILQLVQRELHHTDPVSRRRKRITEGLRELVDHYNWVGFYVMNPAEKTLHLAEYTGAATDHTVIPYGKGICGQVAVSGKTFVAQDVHAESNYIACSIDVVAEIVVPIYRGNTLVAQLDIDSHAQAPFTADEQDFMEKVCRDLGLLFE